MESIVFFIVIIIVINLLGRLLGSGKGKQAPPRRSRPAPRDKKLEGPVDRSVYYRPRESERVFAGFEEEEDVEKEIPQQPVEDKGKRAQWGPYKPARRETGPGQASSLHRVLTRENNLVAAFIFHEIIEPPLAMRKGRKRALRGK